MMVRRVRSKNPDWAAPLVEIMWDKGALMIDAKAGTVDIKTIGAMFSDALKEINEAILKGKENGITK